MTKNLKDDTVCNKKRASTISSFYPESIATAVIDDLWLCISHKDANKLVCSCLPWHSSCSRSSTAGDRMQHSQHDEHKFAEPKAQQIPLLEDFLRRWCTSETSSNPLAFVHILGTGKLNRCVTARATRFHTRAGLLPNSCNVPRA